MPIYGMTINEDDHEDEIGNGLPVIARLRKGGERPASGKAPGKDLDHFRVDFAPEYAHLEPVFVQMYGEAPDRIEGAYIIGQSISSAFPHWYEEWNASTLVHRCDGVTQVRHFNTQLQGYDDNPIKCIKDSSKPCGCKQVGRLNLLLPEFMHRAGVLGTFLLSTSSIHDVISIYKYLNFLEQTVGGIGATKFAVGRREKEVAVNMNGKRSRQKKYMIYLEADADTVMERFNLLQAVDASHMLDSPDHAPIEQRPRQLATPDVEPAYESEPIEDANGDGEIIESYLMSVIIEADRNGKNMLKCQTENGTMWLWSRDKFVDGGYIDRTEWTEVGQGMEFSDGDRPWLRMMVKVKDGQRFLDLMELEPFDPNWDGQESDSDFEGLPPGDIPF